MAGPPTHVLCTLTMEQMSFICWMQEHKQQSNRRVLSRDVCNATWEQIKAQTGSAGDVEFAVTLDLLEAPATFVNFS